MNAEVYDHEPECSKCGHLIERPEQVDDAHLCLECGGKYRQIDYASSMEFLVILVLIAVIVISYSMVISDIVDMF